MITQNENSTPKCPLQSSKILRLSTDNGMREEGFGLGFENHI